MVKRKRELKILSLLIISILFVSIAYAAISGVSFSINGSANAKAGEELIVKFSNLSTDIETSSACLNDSGVISSCATINASVTSDREATFDISGLKGYGDTATVKYKIINESDNANALLDITAITNTNNEYFDITTDLDNASSKVLNSGNYTILTVKAKVKKVLYTSNSATTTVTINIRASLAN